MGDICGEGTDLLFYGFRFSFLRRFVSYLEERNAFVLNDNVVCDFDLAVLLKGERYCPEGFHHLYRQEFIFVYSHFLYYVNFWQSDALVICRVLKNEWG